MSIAVVTLLTPQDVYSNGASEEMVGRFTTERGLRDRLVISSKFSMNGQAGNPNAGGNGRKNLMRAVDASLKRLGTDYIDLYFMHVWDRLTPVEELMRGFDDLISAGKVLHFGLSDMPAWYASRAQMLAEWRGYAPITAFQLEYSLAERNIEREFVPLGAVTGAGIMAWSPLAGGLLSGKYHPSKEGDFGDGRLQVTQGGGNPEISRFSQRNFEIVAALERVAKLIEKPMAQVALNWVTNRPGIAAVILGATKLTQLQNNLSALDFEIPVDLLSELELASALAPQFPYNFHGKQMSSMLTGGTKVSGKPAGYD